MAKDEITVELISSQKQEIGKRLTRNSNIALLNLYNELTDFEQYLLKNRNIPLTQQKRDKYEKLETVFNQITAN